MAQIIAYCKCNHVLFSFYYLRNEPPHEKTSNVAVPPAKTQISLGIRPVWSESSLSAWRKLGSLANHWAHSIDSDQTGWMPRLIWVFAGCTVILLGLSWGGSNRSALAVNCWVIIPCLEVSCKGDHKRAWSASDLTAYNWPTNSELLLCYSCTRADLFRS